MSVGSAIAALLLDFFLGEPKRAHPLVSFGRRALRLEQRFRDKGDFETHAKRYGLIAWLLLCLIPVAVLVLMLSVLPGLVTTLLGIVVLYFCVGLNSLTLHARKVETALKNNDIGAARVAVAAIVSRDCEQMSEQAIIAATVESILENTSDAVIASLFWFLVLGPAACLLHRLANTLDAMWGYRNERYEHFGYWAAKLDDLLNALPAGVTVFAFAAAGRWRRSLECSREQGDLTDSPNAGRVMAAGAGAMGVRLGGPASYDGQYIDRPVLGEGQEPARHHIADALALVRRAIIIVLLLVAAVNGLFA